MKKKYFIVCFIIFVTLACFINIKTKSDTQLQRQVSLFFVHSGRLAQRFKFYPISELNFRVALYIKPDLAWAWNLIGYNKYLQYEARKNYITYDKTQKFLSESLYHYQKAHEFAPKDRQIMLNIALTHKYLHNIPEAIKWLEKLLERDPENTFAYWNLSNIYYEKEDYENALSYINKYIELKPEDIDGIFQKAMIYDSMEKLEESVLLYEKYLDVNPNSVAALVNISGVEIQLKEYDKALKHVNNGLLLNPYSAYLLAYKSEILRKQKKFNEAKAIANRIANFRGQKYLGYRELAKISYQEGEKDKAEKYLKDAKKEAQSYLDKYCGGKQYNIDDKSGNCSNRFAFIKYGGLDD